jgi:RNA polymerase sigma factor (sigma-70 family)
MTRAAPGKTQSEASSSDPELLTRLSSGEIGALGELYDRHHAAVRRLVAHMSGNADDVDDLVHNTFLTAAQSAARYDGRTNCRPWLMGIAVHLLKRRRHAFARWLELVPALRVGRPSSDDARHVLMVRSDVHRALMRLSEPKRLAILLTEVEGLSCQEVADLLAIPLGTVWTRVHAARRELRASLAEPLAGNQINTETERRASATRGAAADPHHAGVGCEAPPETTFRSAAAEPEKGQR